MEYAKLILTPTSPIISELQSDTIFGHFAWGIRFVYGEERLKELLKDFKEKPFIIFSNGFIKGFLPKPFLEPYLPNDNELKYAKEVKKKSLIDKEFIFNNIDNLNDKKIFQYLKEKKYKFEQELNITQKNSVNRNSNLVKEGLYTIKEKFVNQDYEIYFAYQNISKEEIGQVFNFIAKRGYGKDKSAGKGKFTFKIDWDFEEKKYFTTKKERFINLSTMFRSNNMHLLYGKTITKFPKAGGFYASSEPYKNPCIMYLPGSTFIVEGEVLGRAEERVYNKNNHYQNGFSIGIYYNEVGNENNS